MIQKTQKFAYLICILALIGLSFGGPLGKLAINYGGHPFAIIIWRMAFSVPVMAVVWIVFNKRNKNIKVEKVTSKAKLINVLSGCFLGLHYTAWYMALANTTVFNATALGSLQPIYVMVISYLVFKEKPARGVFLSVIMALAGTIILILPSAMNPGETSVLGNLMAFLSGIFFAAYLICGRYALKSISIGGFTTVAYGVCMILILIFALIFNVNIMVGINIIIICLLLAVVSTVLGHSLINWSLQFLSVVAVTIILLGEVVGATIIAYFMFGSIPGVIEIIGGVIVLISITIFVMRANRSERVKN